MKTGTQFFNACMDEIHHLSCMLVVLLRDQQQQFILEHTGESKDRIPIAAVWECLLGAFRIQGTSSS